MAVQSPFFGKRDSESFPAQRVGTTTSVLGASPLGSAAAAGHNAASLAASTNVAASARESSGSTLTVGPNIKLKGVEITDCDTLVVEGLVEATMSSRVIHIAEQGTFKGSADMDVAEIRGEFSGDLTVRHQLLIHSTGKVSGKIRYGKLVVEEGGQLMGDIAVAGHGFVAAVRPTAPTVQPVTLAAAKVA